MKKMMASFAFLFLATTVQAAESACADFTGFWSGICTQNGAPTNSPNLSFQQRGCEALQDGLNGYMIGYTRTVTHKNKMMEYTQDVTLSWNADKTKLNQTIAIDRHDKTTGRKVSGSESGYIELTSPTQLHAVLEGKLKIKEKNKPTQLVDANVDCVYNKQ